MAYEKIFENDKVRVVAELEGDRPCISFSDLTDLHNEPRGFTRGKRGLKKAVEMLKEMVKNEEVGGLGMYDVCRLLDSKFNLKCHTYCALD